MLASLLAILTVFRANQAAGAEKASVPNVVLILADDKY